MGCTMSPEEINNRIKVSIERVDFCEIHNLLSHVDHKILDPSLIHLAVISGQIDIIAIFIENSVINRFQS